ncbi:hypothetical protein BC629DRAFT_1436595 [Irpex lacteus]|nr:hypothetical protein BC629DRAFT_1436595 [Irpex lacteus]
MSKLTWRGLWKVHRGVEEIQPSEKYAYPDISGGNTSSSGAVSSHKANWGAHAGQTPPCHLCFILAHHGSESTTSLAQRSLAIKKPVFQLSCAARAILKLFKLLRKDLPVSVETRSSRIGNHAYPFVLFSHGGLVLKVIVFMKNVRQGLGISEADAKISRRIDRMLHLAGKDAEDIPHRIKEDPQTPDPYPIRVPCQPPHPHLPQKKVAASQAIRHRQITYKRLHTSRRACASHIDISLEEEDRTNQVPTVQTGGRVSLESVGTERKQLRDERCMGGFTEGWTPLVVDLVFGKHCFILDYLK